MVIKQNYKMINREINKYLLQMMIMISVHLILLDLKLLLIQTENRFKVLI